MGEVREEMERGRGRMIKNVAEEANEVMNRMREHMENKGKEKGIARK